MSGSWIVFLALESPPSQDLGSFRFTHPPKSSASDPQVLVVV